MNIGKPLATNFLKLVLTATAVHKQFAALLLRFGSFKAIDFPATTELTVLEKISELSTVEGTQFDLVFGDVPYGMMADVFHCNIGKEYIWKSLQLLKDDGNAFVIVEPTILVSDTGKQFINRLSAESLYYNSVFELPEETLCPVGLVYPIILHFERQKRDNLFIANITDDCDTLFKSFSKSVSTSKLETGMFVGRDNFSSFGRFRDENLVDIL
jgi:hypothetical protein